LHYEVGDGEEDVLDFGGEVVDALVFPGGALVKVENGSVCECGFDSFYVSDGSAKAYGVRACGIVSDHPADVCAV